MDKSMENISEQFDENFKETLVEKAQEPEETNYIHDQALRVYDPERNVNVIPTDWRGFKAITSPVANGLYETYATGSRFNDAYKAYTDERIMREQILAYQAYGKYYSQYEDRIIRSAAADEVKTRREDLLLTAAEESTKIGVEPSKITTLLASKPGSDDKDLERVALEILSTENQMEQTLEDNEKNRLVGFSDSDTMLQSFDHIWTQGKILEKYLNAAESDYNNANLLKKGAYLFGEIVMPMYKNIKSKIKDPLDVPFHFLAYNTRKEQMEAVWEAARELSPEDFDAFCAFTYKAMLDLSGDPAVPVDFFDAVLTGPKWQEDRDAFLDLIIGGVGLSKVMKGFARASKDVSAAKKAKNSKKIIEETEEAVAIKNAEETTKDTAEAVVKAAEQAKKVKRETRNALVAEGVADAGISERLIQNTSDTTMLPNADVIVPLGDKAITAAVINEDSLATTTAKLYNSQVSPVAFTEDQKKLWIKSKTESLKDELKKQGSTANYGLKDTVDIYQKKNGEYGYRAYIGTGTDNTLPFVSKEGLEECARSMRLLPGEYKAVEDVDGWWMLLDKSVKNEGYMYKDWQGEFSAGPIKKYFTTRMWTPDFFHAQDVAYETGKAGRSKILLEDSQNIFKKLSREDERTLDTILAEEKQAGVRYDRSKLIDDMGVNEKVADAHAEYFKINDLARTAKNNQARHWLAVNGYGDIRVGKDKYLAKQIKGLPESAWSNAVIKDINTGEIFDSTITSEAWDKLVKEKDYVMVRYFEPIAEDTDAGTTFVQYMMGPRGSFEVHDLPMEVIGFKPEGSIMYSEHMLYAKQPVTWTSANHKRMFMATGFADLDMKAIKKQTQELNDALHIYRDYKAGNIDATTAGIRLNESTAGNEYFKVGGLEDFEKYVRTKDNPTGLIQDWKYDFEVLRNGEESKQFGRLRAEGFLSDDAVLDPTEEMIRLEISSKWERKKTKLTDFNGGLTPTLNARRTILANINNAVNMDTRRDYVEYYGREFKSMFGDIIKPQYDHMSDEELLRTKDALIEPRVGIDRKMYEAAKNMQDHFMLVADSMTDWDKQWAAMVKHYAEVLGDSDFAKNFTSLQRGGRLFEAIENIPEPSKMLKTLGYFSQMGMWNIRQLPMQALGTVNTLLMSPIQGPRMLGKLSPAMAAIAAKDEKQLAKAIEALKFHGDMGTEEAKGLAAYLRRVALDTTEQRLSQYASSLGMEGFKHSNTMFFRWGEKINAVTSAGTAYLEYIAKHPDKVGKILSNEDYVKILGRQDDLFLNMTKANDSLLQKGALTRAASQYTAFAMRSLEACLGKHFTGAEKALFLLGNMMLWGYAGLTGMNGYNMYSWMNENGVNSEWAEAFRSGIVGAIARKLGMEGVDFSEFGPQLFGEGWTGRLGDIIDDGTIDVLSMIPATQVFGIAKDLPDTARLTMEVIKDLVYPSRTDEELTSHIFSIATNNTPASLSRYSQAYLAVKLGKLIDKNGNVVRDNMTFSQALYHALGFKGTERIATEIFWEMDKDFDKRTKEFVKDLKPIWNNYRNTMSDTAKQEFENTYAMMLFSIDDYQERVSFAKAVHSMQKQNAFGTVIDNTRRNAIKRHRTTFPKREKMIENPSFRSL